MIVFEPNWYHIFLWDCQYPSSSLRHLSLKFCTTRWTEDAEVAKPAILIWPHMVKYINIVDKRPKSKRPTCNSYSTVTNIVKDLLTLAKLQIFVAVASELKEFLTIFQGDTLLTPFLHQYVKGMYSKLLEKVISQKVFFFFK